ncbi:alpha-(1,3)-fucosyltransferase C-like [Penaeus japonicus]|uniref:alpha-(1,3)-fucosyltransferase C-like n=1 Tax=Penaeus japonicus TaxID=27405 RepID=UPI001C7139D7|nr:alpha-(1,3)-fucosyltransferase C-like [Penaeus japonicus]
MKRNTTQISAATAVFILCGISGVLVIVIGQLLDRFTAPSPALFDPVSKSFARVSVPAENLTQVMDKKPKLILYWTSWFGGKWAGRFTSDTMEGLHDMGCPEWQCEFTYDRARITEADAVLFRSLQFSVRPDFRRPSQRWIWTDVEAPTSGPAKRATTILRVHRLSSLVNWTMTYHLNSDVVANYGHFRSLHNSSLPLHPHLIESHQATLSQYLSAVAKGMTLEDIMGPSWRAFVDRPQVVAWMSSHCGTVSKREDYVQELSKYVPVDRYGRCGKRCGGRCWVDILSRNYSFYMGMENSLCDEYVTEKLYLPLVYNLVPVVWGASNYSQLMPPNSYIDARDYHPKELAELLQRLSADPVAYGKYHVWRGFWEARVGGTFCELCHRLHTDQEEKHYADLNLWRAQNNKCQIVPRNMFAPEVNAWRSFIRSNYSD